VVDIMKTQLRIVAGSLRGRKLSCTVNPNLRPTPQMVREALFSILGNAIPDRPFFDVFAGTGVVGLEALSRGASAVTFLERDFRLTAAIEETVRAFGVSEQCHVLRTDVYRWATLWQPPPEPVNVFFSPPFIDYTRRPEDLLGIVARLQKVLHPGSVVVLQAEKHSSLDELIADPQWEHRRYGRNELLIWVREEETVANRSATSGASDGYPGPTDDSDDGA
jgi:16S rRNA (guanine(966)-N(2))-methyltransferase RsmD